MVGARLAAVLLLCALLAGCSGAPSDVAASGGSSTTTSTGPGANVTLPRLGPAERVTLYFTASGDLSFDLPAEGSVVIGTPAGGFASGIDPREFELPPAPHAMLITDEDIQVRAFVKSSLPQYSNGAFDFAAQVGSTRASGLWGFMPGQPVVAPGTPQEFRLRLAFGDQRGILLLEGDSIRALVAGQFGRESGEPHMLVGGSQPSRIELTLRNYTVDPLEDATGVMAESFTGTVTGASTMTSCDTVPGTTSSTRDVTIDAEAVGFEVRLESANGHDVDLALLDAGRVVAAGHSALGTEAVFLAADTLDGLQGATLTLKVTACGSGPINYEIEMEQTTAEAADDAPQ